MTNPPDLATTLHELLNPRVEIVDRDHDDLAAAEAEHQAHVDQLTAQHAAHLRAHRAGQARRVLARLMDVRRRWDAGAERRRTARGELPSRLDQLADAVLSSQGSGGASAGPHRLPFTAAAAELLAAIERAVGGDRVAHGRHQRRIDAGREFASCTADCRPVALASRVWAWARTAGDEAVPLASGWLVEACAILEPERPIPIDGACPKCRMRTVYVDDAGEQVRRSALQVDRTSGLVTCTAGQCDASWGPEYHAHLGQVLEQQRAEQGGSAA